MSVSRPAWWLLGALTFGVTCALFMGAKQPLLSEGALTNARVDASAIDLFTASPAELLFFPGIGDRLARSVHHGIRAEGIQSIQELKRLRGIGPARVAAIREALRSKGR